MKKVVYFLYPKWSLKAKVHKNCSLKKSATARRGSRYSKHEKRSHRDFLNTHRSQAGSPGNSEGVRPYTGREPDGLVFLRTAFGATGELGGVDVTLPLVVMSFFESGS